MDLIKEKYSDFGPTLAHEKLPEVHQLQISRESVRRIMVEKRIWKLKRDKEPAIHQMRERRAWFGELVQIDGSDHAWFEDRGPKCTLLVYIDDATGQLLELWFVADETTFAYFEASRHYSERYGKPVAFYSDKHSLFRVNQEQATGLGSGLTQFGRAMQDLDIHIICANSAQAKGRVERANQILQDRLVKELRLRGISDMEAGNAYLPEFREDLNSRFAVKLRSTYNAHRPLLMSENLDLIFTHQKTGTLSKNLTVQSNKVIYQIQSERPDYSLRNAKCGKISVCNHLRQCGYEYTLTSLHTSHPGSESFKSDLAKFLGVCRVVRRLRTVRLGAIGARPGSFQTVRYSEKILQASGITVTTIDLSEILGDAARISDDSPRIKTKLETIQSYAKHDTVPSPAMVRMAKLGLVIDDWMQANDLQATALQCRTSIQKYYGINACTLMSMMSNQLLPSACEVDITGVVSMYALQLASASPAALVDWNNNYADDPDRCVFFHCGNWAKSFIPDIEIKTAPILGTTLGEENTYGAMAGRAAAGKMTYDRVSTDDTSGIIRAYTGEGELTNDPLENFGHRAVVYTPNLQKLLAYLCKNGFEHHVAMSMGHVAPILTEALSTYMKWDVGEFIISGVTLSIHCFSSHSSAGADALQAAAIQLVEDGFEHAFAFLDFGRYFAVHHGVMIVDGVPQLVGGQRRDVVGIVHRLAGKVEPVPALGIRIVKEAFGARQAGSSGARTPGIPPGWFCPGSR